MRAHASRKLLSTVGLQYHNICLAGPGDFPASCLGTRILLPCRHHPLRVRGHHGAIMGSKAAKQTMPSPRISESFFCLKYSALSVLLHVLASIQHAPPLTLLPLYSRFHNLAMQISKFRCYKTTATPTVSYTRACEDCHLRKGRSKPCEISMGTC
jgi:hypothetical protein